MAKANTNTKRRPADDDAAMIDIAIDGAGSTRRDYTIKEWCARRRISVPTFWNHLRLGIGPRLSPQGGRRVITVEADDEYQRRLNAGELVIPRAPLRVT